MELVTQNKTVRVPAFVCWKKLASILIGDGVWNRSEIDRQTGLIPKARNAALDTSLYADIGKVGMQ